MKIGKIKPRWAWFGSKKKRVIFSFSPDGTGFIGNIGPFGFCQDTRFLLLVLGPYTITYKKRFIDEL